MNMNLRLTATVLVLLAIVALTFNQVQVQALTHTPSPIGSWDLSTSASKLINGALAFYPDRHFDETIYNTGGGVKLLKSGHYTVKGDLLTMCPGPMTEGCSSFHLSGDANNLILKSLQKRGTVYLGRHPSF